MLIKALAPAAIAAIASAFFWSGAHAAESTEKPQTLAKQLTAACKAKPKHEICVALAAKRAAAKERRDAKLRAQIAAVNGD